MKKGLIFVAFILISIFVKAQNAANGLSWLNGNAIYQSTHSTVNITQNVLFNAARNWVLYNTNGELISEDPQKGQITGQGSFNASAKAMLILTANYTICFKVKITCYTARYTLCIYDISYAKNRLPQSVAVAQLSHEPN